MGPIVLKPILLGGWHASTENTNKVERYDIQKNIWSFVSPMIERRYRPGVAVLGGKIYVLGGEEGIHIKKELNLCRRCIRSKT